MLRIERALRRSEDRRREGDTRRSPDFWRGQRVAYRNVLVDVKQTTDRIMERFDQVLAESDNVAKREAYLRAKQIVWEEIHDLRRLERIRRR